MVCIRLENVSLEYPVYNVNASSLRHKLINMSTGGRIAKSIHDKTVVRSLSNINLNISSGDRLGIMGHNGAGKTTLLRCIAGIYAPTSGKVVCEGSLVPLIEIGAGIEPELSGFDNIRRLLHLRGWQSDAVSRITKEIVAFSELGEFLALPVRTYSSGMMMRLMFAACTAGKPDILVMDEFFSVGDKEFHQKAEAHLAQEIHDASILVFASHSEALLKRMCNRFVRLSNGQLEEIVI